MRGARRRRLGFSPLGNDQSTDRPNTITTAVQSIFHFLELSTCHYLGVCGTKISLAGPGDLHHTSDSRPGVKIADMHSHSQSPLASTLRKKSQLFPRRPAPHCSSQGGQLRSRPTLRKFSADSRSGVTNQRTQAPQPA